MELVRVHLEFEVYCIPYISILISSHFISNKLYYSYSLSPCPTRYACL
uniref:Uncharacterized protein n=1 Tax=Anguilla anguilla TaxID=7936 RepID=A0A0E9SRQ6_ANGAN